MYQGLKGLHDALRRFTSTFDPARLSPANASTVVSLATAIKAMAGTIEALAAARAAETNEWKEAGFRSAAEALARQTGTSVSQAKETLATGKQLDQHPEIARSARAGELSPTQTSMCCDGAAADPNAAGQLVQKAKQSSFSDLRDEVGRTKAGAADEEARRRTIRLRRRCRTWTDQDGAWHLHATGPAEDGAQVDAALAPITNTIFHQARKEGRKEPHDAYAFDALVQLAMDSTSQDSDKAEPPGPTCGPQGPPPEPPPPPAVSRRGKPRHPRRRRRGAPAKILVRIDYDTWLRGVARPGETCELVGYGSVPVSVVDDLLERSDPFVAAILTKGQKLVGVAHLGRAPTATQQSALEWLYPSCAVEGCPATARLERDHRVDWAKTNYTMIDLLDHLCSHHHALKTRQGWALVEGTGKRPLVPPSDPRHPNRQQARAPAAS